MEQRVEWGLLLLYGRVKDTVFCFIILLHVSNKFYDPAEFELNQKVRHQKMFSVQEKTSFWNVDLGSKASGHSIR